MYGWVNSKADLILDCFEMACWSAIAFITLQDTPLDEDISYVLEWVIIVSGIVVWVVPNLIPAVAFCIAFGAEVCEMLRANYDD